MSVQPGWYKDPADPSTQRYWDGEGWIGKPLSIDATPPPGPPPVEPEPLAAPSRQATGTPPAPTGPVEPPGPALPPAPPGWPYPYPTQATPRPSPPGAVPPGWPQYPIMRIRPHGLALAGLGRRLAARMIDILLVLLLNVLVNGWFVWSYVQEITPMFQEIMRRSLAGDSSTEGIPQASGRADGLQVVIILIAVALWFAYEVPAVANSGQTVGKRLLGLKVVALAEAPELNFGQAFRRWNTLALPTFLWYCCGIGFLLQLIDCAFPLFDRTLRQALHDKRAQTVVVRAPHEPTAAPPGSRQPAPDQLETRSDKPAGDGPETPGGSPR